MLHYLLFLHNRAFRLFHLTGVPLTPYHFNGPNCPTLYNDILQVDQQPNKVDVFGFGVTNGGLVPDRFVIFVYMPSLFITAGSVVPHTDPHPHFLKH